MAQEYIKPHILMMSEITADGKLTLKKGASSKILMKYMDKATEILLHRTRAEYDAIMVGSNTIKIDNSFPRTSVEAMFSLKTAITLFL